MERFDESEDDFQLYSEDDIDDKDYMLQESDWESQYNDKNTLKYSLQERVGRWKVR